jgi:hypothetical protein
MHACVADMWCALHAAPREFDFSAYRQRHVALEVMYFGWSFQGFARQDSTENTIEVRLLLSASCWLKTPYYAHHALLSYRM